MPTSFIDTRNLARQRESVNSVPRRHGNVSIPRRVWDVLRGKRNLGNVLGPDPKRSGYTYVDRAGLDKEVESALNSGLHLVIHGESKFGKSWLRARTLPERKVARVQCRPQDSEASVMEAALGIIQAQEPAGSRQTKESRDAASMAIGTSGINARAGSEAVQRIERDSKPVGQGAGYVDWVAKRFLESKRVPVFEDFHHLPRSAQQDMSFTIKALGDLGVYCVVIGIWTDSHLLTVHNGELTGRVRDVRLKWTLDELVLVVTKTCSALRVEIDPALAKEIAREANGSVGAVQMLTREVLLEARMTAWSPRTRVLSDTELLRKARGRALDSIAPRYARFEESVPRVRIDGVRDGLYGALITAVFKESERRLLVGIPADEVLTAVQVELPDAEEDDLLEALEQLDHVQTEAEVSPNVLAFDRTQNRLVLADRMLLFYLRHRFDFELNTH